MQQQYICLFSSLFIYFLFVQPIFSQIEEDSTFINHKVYKVVEEMPRFPGCEDIFNATEREKCANESLLKFLYRHFKIAPSSKETGITTTAAISFVVEKNGHLSNINVIRDINGILGNELSRVINLMNEQNIRWIAGKQDGIPVRVQLNLPIRIHLE